MSQQARHMHPLGFEIKRGINGWPLFSHQVREAWWILTGKWSLHRAWQKGYDDHASQEFGRQIATGQIKLYGTAPAEREYCEHGERAYCTICHMWESLPLPAPAPHAEVREALKAFLIAYGSQDSSTKGLDDAAQMARAVLALPQPEREEVGQK